jgi:hypothetical protein
MQGVNYVDALGLPSDAIENLVAAVNTLPHAAIFVPRHERVGEGHICNAHALVPRRISRMKLSRTAGSRTAGI